MVNYQKLFSRCFRVVSNIELERGGGGGGGGVMKFVLLMCINFAILAGMVSRVMCNIVV
jgi:hypothetical protein